MATCAQNQSNQDDESGTDQNGAGGGTTATPESLDPSAGGHFLTGQTLGAPGLPPRSSAHSALQQVARNLPVRMKAGDEKDALIILLY